ncbi:LysE family translocator [Rhizobium sp. PAMB 3182]
MDLPTILPHLAVAWSVYFLAVISPGPATLAIAGTAMANGRSRGMALATGVITGSFIWAILAALGLSALLTQFAYALTGLKIAGGCYLLWLGWKNLRSAVKADYGSVARMSHEDLPLKVFYLRGLGIHLTNPKAIFVWMSLVSLGLPAHAPSEVVYIFIGGAMVIGFISFNMLAVLFSTEPMVRGYAKARRVIEGAMGLFFGLAGLKLLTSRI